MKIKSLFISDLHLGCKRNNCHAAIETIKRYDFDNLFMLGDIIDIKALADDWRWEDAENYLWDIICSLAQTKHVVYILGNHERCYFDGVSYLNQILFIDHYVYKNIYLCHGHQFDVDCDSIKWPKSLVSLAYNGTSKYNLKICSQLKRMARRMPGYLSSFKDNAFKHLENVLIMPGVDSIMVGHTHQQEMEVRNNLTYYNCGDFREDSNYIIEHLDGTMELK